MGLKARSDSRLKAMAGIRTSFAVYFCGVLTMMGEFPLPSA